jgi:CxxC motif-containing protein
MKLKYGVPIAVLVFLFATACYVEGAELCKENGGAVYSVPGQSIDRVTAGKKVVENIVSVKNSMQEMNSAALQKQLDKEREGEYLNKARAGKYAPLVEYDNGKIVSLTIFTAKGNPLERYIFNDGVLIQRTDYEMQKGDKKDPHAPLIEFKGWEIVSLTIFYNKYAVQLTFDQGFVLDICEREYGKEKAIDIRSIVPLVEYDNGKIVSLTTYTDKGQPEDTYIFGEVNGKTRIVQSVHYGNGKDGGSHSPLIEYEDGKMVSLTIFTNKGKQSDKYTFAEIGGVLKIVQSIHYGAGKVKDVPANTGSTPGGSTGRFNQRRKSA